MLLVTLSLLSGPWVCRVRRDIIHVAGITWDTVEQRWWYIGSGLVWFALDYYRVNSLGSCAGASAVCLLAHLSREGATASLWRTGLWQQGEVLQAPAGMSHSLIRCAGAPAM